MQFPLISSDLNPIHTPPVILCIEDRPSALILRKLVLEKAGYAVLSASSGAEALQLLQNRDVDLVLSDHYLKGELGTGIAAQMKALKPAVPILIISGSAGTLEPSSNVDAVIQKNTGPTSLLVAIAKILGL